MNNDIVTDLVIEQDTNAEFQQAVLDNLDKINKNVYTATFIITFVLSVIVGVLLGKVLKLWKK